MEKRFFIALLPPEEIQVEVNLIKQYFRDRYDSHAALRSPPHITLQPPFTWSVERLPELEDGLAEFAGEHFSLPIILSNFGAFPPRVIYVDVVQQPELLKLQTDLAVNLETCFGIVDPAAKDRSFIPHMTVAFRDLSEPNFQIAWADFQGRSLGFSFIANNLTLLIHDGQSWQIQTNFPLVHI